nr:reverse transcriptase domain-containing protein [Tanacetum cinerariifolium]
MSTRSSARNLFPPLDNPELTIQRRSHSDPTLLNNSEMAAEGKGNLPVPDLRTMEELCQPSLNGRGGPIASISIQATNFGLKNDMIQQVQNSCQFHGLPGGTFLKRRLKECYDLIENMTVHHNDWDTSAQRSESSSSIISSFDTKITALKAEMVEINKNLMRVLQVNQQVKAVTPNCETCGGPHSFNDCPATVGNTQNIYDAGAYQAYQAPAYQAPVYQAPIHQPHIPQPQIVATNEFTNFMKANDAILKNMQTNMTYLKNSNLELKNMFGQFMTMNTASSLGSRTLPGNTITNPKEDLKGITTRSGTAYPGPTIPTTYSSLVVERETEATKDMVHPTNIGSTEDVQPLVNFTERTLLGGSPKEVARKTRRPSKFLIPCDFNGMAEFLALADLGASINLMPLTVWNKLSLPDLSLTCMTLELVDRLISHPVGVFKDVFVKVGTFHFSVDFVVVDFDADPRVPLILRRYFFKTRRDLIEVFEGELTLRVGKEAITFNLDQTSRYLANYNDMTANRIDIIDMDCEEYSQEVLGFSDVITSGNPTPYYDPIVSTTSLTVTPFGNSDFLLEEVDVFLALEDDPMIDGFRDLSSRDIPALSAKCPGRTFIKRRPKECYVLIENMTAYHNDWDTSAQRSESSSSISSSYDREIAALKAEMAEINKTLMRVLQVNQQVKTVTLSCKTCGGPHSFSDYPATVGNTQNVYAAGAYQGNSYQPQGNRNLLSYHSDNYLGPPVHEDEYRFIFGFGNTSGNIITNPKEELKGVTTRSGTAYQEPTIPTTSSSLPLVVERETEATKDTVHPTNNESILVDGGPKETGIKDLLGGEVSTMMSPVGPLWQASRMSRASLPCTHRQIT